SPTELISKANVSVAPGTSIVVKVDSFGPAEVTPCSKFNATKERIPSRHIFLVVVFMIFSFLFEKLNLMDKKQTAATLAPSTGQRDPSLKLSLRLPFTPPASVLKLLRIVFIGFEVSPTPSPPNCSHLVMQDSNQKRLTLVRSFFEAPNQKRN